MDEQTTALAELASAVGAGSPIDAATAMAREFMALTGREVVVALSWNGRQVVLPDDVGPDVVGRLMVTAGTQGPRRPWGELFDTADDELAVVLPVRGPGGRFGGAVATRQRQDPAERAPAGRLLASFAVVLGTVLERAAIDEAGSERLRALVEATPSALLLLRAGDLTVEVANERAAAMLRRPVSELECRHVRELGRPLDETTADRLRQTVPRLTPGTSLSLPAAWYEMPNGVRLETELTYVSLAPDGELLALYLYETGRHLDPDGSAADGSVRPEHRLNVELGDDVVQGLAAAAEALAEGRIDSATRLVDGTLASARRALDLLVATHHRPMAARPDLVRTRATPGSPPVPPAEVGDGEEGLGLLLVDDADDLRLLLRLLIEDDPRFRLVGEAANGLEALDTATRVRPDVVLLDLAMPVMDGLATLPRLRELHPDVPVVVLSGFGEESLGEAAIAAGALAYVEKGGGHRRLLDEVARLVRPPATGARLG